MRKDEKLSEAVKQVNDAITADRERLEKISSEDEQEPIMLEGETCEGFYCQIMIDPKPIAKIMLRHDYSTWRILGEDAPDEMWEEMGRYVGLKTVSMVDL